MNKRTGEYALSLTLATLFTAPIALAFRGGPPSGYSGGLLGGSANCTECHGYHEGNGRVELIGVPKRYQPTGPYDLTIRVSDPDLFGAGFEISAEGNGRHQGTFYVHWVEEPTHVQFAEGFDQNYVSHTETGVDHSVASWEMNGQSATYHIQWAAPREFQPQVDITFFVAALAINNNHSLSNDRYYATYARSQPVVVYGDADGDGDVDLVDAASMQLCADVEVTGLADGCRHSDLNGDGSVNLSDWERFELVMFGPTATLPAEYVLADVVRGGLLYDRWWTVNGAPEPAGIHPLYPQSGLQSGSVTFQCQECHGWDYQGVDGQYGSGPHFTGIGGILDTKLTSSEIFDLLKADPGETPNGHNMDAYGLSDADLWDTVKFTLEGVVHTHDYIDDDGLFIGDNKSGGFTYFNTCASCHGEDGTAIALEDHEEHHSHTYVGTIANENPWEFLHKIRFGQPGTPMSSTVLLGYSAASDALLGAYAQSLPVK